MRVCPRKKNKNSKNRKHSRLLTLRAQQQMTSAPLPSPTSNILHHPNWAQLRDIHRQALFKSVAEHLDTVNRQISANIQRKVASFEATCDATGPEAQIIQQYLIESAGDWLKISHTRHPTINERGYTNFHFEVTFANNTLFTDMVQQLKKANRTDVMPTIEAPVEPTKPPIVETVTTGYAQLM
jgi:hypothetical protein